jgi:hypothetical protein
MHTCARVRRYRRPRQQPHEYSHVRLEAEKTVTSDPSMSHVKRSGLGCAMPAAKEMSSKVACEWRESGRAVR